MSITEQVKSILAELPPGVMLEAAAKTRTADEIREAIGAGVRIIGENYLQDAEPAFESIGHAVRWHFIGHLQKNKIKKAVQLFDMIETVDTLELAREIDKRCGEMCKAMPVLIEINSGREPQKSGVMPEGAVELVRAVAGLPNIRVEGLMTIGPGGGTPAQLRNCFRETRELFERLRGLNLPGVEMKYLSMGMTDSYPLAIAEQANIIRIGSKIFGAR